MNLFEHIEVQLYLKNCKRVEIIEGMVHSKHFISLTSYSELFTERQS